MNDTTADLDTEVRRLRIRIIGLTPTQLAQVGESAAGTRRQTIAEALAEFSRIGSAGRPVPDIGDHGLADQVVVLIDTGIEAAKTLPPAQGQEMLERLHTAAVDLRRNLA